MKTVNLPKIVDELRAAKLWGLPFTIRGDGVIESDRLTDEQRRDIAAVVEAHDATTPRDPEVVRGQERAEALAALLGIPLAEAALDGFLKSIKARPDLPAAARDYIEKHKL